MYNLRSRRIQRSQSLNQLSDSSESTTTASLTPPLANMSEDNNSIPPGQGQNPPRFLSPVVPTGTAQTKFDKYDGLSKDIRIQTWLTLFEVHTQDANDTDRTRALLYNLKGPALEWYGDEIASSVVPLTWLQVRERMIRRFGIGTATPLIDAQRRRLRRDETVEQYFRDKMRLLRQTNISEREICHQLTEGLPFQWRLSLTAARITDSNAWVEVAQQVETHFASLARSQLRPNSTPQYQRPTGNNFRPRDNQRPNPRALAAAPNGRPPNQPPPCRMCQRRGRTEHHWHRDCPHRDPNWQPQPRRYDQPHTQYADRSQSASPEPLGANVAEDRPDSAVDLNV